MIDVRETGGTRSATCGAVVAVTRGGDRVTGPCGDVDIADGIVGVLRFVCSRPSQEGGALRGDAAGNLGMSANFVRTEIYPAGWVADKTGVRERAAGERLNEDLGAQGGAPPSFIIIPLN